MLCNLLIENEVDLEKCMVLEVGAGRTTLCEVQVKAGPEYGLIVEPTSEEAVRFDVADFVDHLTSIVRANDQTDSLRQPDLTSEEIRRAIRNLANLITKKSTDATGKPVWVDPAKELAERIVDPNELVIQILSPHGFGSPSWSNIWYPGDSSMSPREWLKQTFSQLNNGRHPDFSLPHRIEVVVPQPILGTATFDLRLIDTKGIDQTAQRGFGTAL